MVEVTSSEGFGGLLDGGDDDDWRGGVMEWFQEVEGREDES